MIAWALGAAALAAPLDVRVRERADGDPIGGAEVAVDGGGTATTDPDGRAAPEAPGDGPWTVTISAPGFASATVVVEPPPDTVRVWLQPRAAALEVVVEGLQASADTTRHAVDAEMALETPGTLEDAVRLVQSLPGVTVQREYSPTSGDLSVRGSAPGDSRYYLDGIEIPYLYHFNQYASVFPASQIGSLELFPSTFSARYGDAVGAIVEAESRLEVPEAVHGGAHLNFVMAGGDLAVPLGRRWWLSVSGRRSYQDLGGERSTQYTVWPIFHDFTVRAEQGTREDGVGIFVVGAGDTWTRAAGELDVLDPLEASTTPYLEYHQGFQVLGARRQWSNPGTSGRLVGAVVHHARSGELVGLGGEDLDTVTATSRLDVSARPEDRIGWDAGYELIAARTALVVDPAGPAGIRVAEEAPALARGEAVDDAMLRVKGGVYGTAHLPTGPLRWMPGLRLGGDRTTDELLVEPRGAVRWTVSDQTMLKLGGGRYLQRPETELLFPGTGDPDLPTTDSWQLAGGWEQTVAGRLELGLEAYRKWMTDPILTPIDGPPVALPSGEATGVELITRYRLREVFFAWGWLALQRTRLVDEEGLRIPGDGDQAVSGGVVLSWDVGRSNLGMRYRYASGLPFTPLEGSSYDAGNDDWVPNPGSPNSARLPDYHKVDLRYGYTIPMRGWSLDLTAELWIVPKVSAQLYPTWNYDYTEQGWVVGPTMLPLLGARATF